MSTFISVHVGAGFQVSEKKYSDCLLRSTEAGNKILKDGGSSLEAVVAAIEILENDGITNCGKGSALNLNQEVQCDASCMESSDLLWASVGSVSKLKNPIKAAKCLLLAQKNKHPDKLLNPLFLTGKGAREWALEHGCEASNDLVTDQALDLFEKHRLELSKLKNETINQTINEQLKPIKRRRLDSSSSSLSEDKTLYEHAYSISGDVSLEHKNLKAKILDTVGAIAVDKFGNCSSAVSSGGIMFKDKGRIGQAAVYGCGVWSEENVSVTTTGVGEYLIKTMFAKKSASKLIKASKQIDLDQFDKFNFSDVIKKAFIDNFLNSKYLKNTDHDKLIGVLSLIFKPEIRKLHLIWAHNTPSMFIAYATNDLIKPIFSKKDLNSNELVNVNSVVVDY